MERETLEKVLETIDSMFCSNCKEGFSGNSEGWFYCPYCGANLTKSEGMNFEYSAVIKEIVSAIKNNSKKRIKFWDNDKEDWLGWVYWNGEKIVIESLESQRKVMRRILKKYEVI